MKETEVFFHHIRDWPWREKFCPKHGWRPYFHECGIKAEKVAHPQVKLPAPEQPAPGHEHVPDVERPAAQVGPPLALAMRDQAKVPR